MLNLSTQLICLLNVLALLCCRLISSRSTISSFLVSIAGTMTARDRQQRWIQSPHHNKFFFNWEAFREEPIWVSLVASSLSGEWQSFTFPNLPSFRTLPQHLFAHSALLHSHRLEMSLLEWNTDKPYHFVASINSISHQWQWISVKAMKERHLGWQALGRVVEKTNNKHHICLNFCKQS